MITYANSGRELGNTLEDYPSNDDDNNESYQGSEQSEDESESNDDSGEDSSSSSGSSSSSDDDGEVTMSAKSRFMTGRKTHILKCTGSHMSMYRLSLPLMIPQQSINLQKIKECKAKTTLKTKECRRNLTTIASKMWRAQEWTT
jgi:hypothetical protein